MARKKRLGELLIEAGVIDEAQLKAALGHQRQWGVRLGQALVDLKLATESDVVRALSTKFDFPVADLGALEPYALEQALALLPREFAVRHNAFPMAADTQSVTVAMSDPTNLAVVDEISFRTGRRVKVCMGGDREIADAVRHHYPGSGEEQVEAIALDLDVEDVGPENAVLDPFGGGSKDALEAFFSHAPEHAAAAPASAAPAVPATPPAAPVPTTAPAMPAAARPRPAPSAPAAARPRPATPAPAAAPGPAAPWPAPAETLPATPAAPHPAPPRPGAPATRPATPPAVAPAPRQASPPPPGGAAQRSPWAAPGLAFPGSPARVPATASAPAAAPRVELELEASRGEASRGEVVPAELAPFPAGEPILATDLAPEEGSGEGQPAPRPLTPDEVGILDAITRLAHGHHAEPDIVKPAQAMAALVKLLLRKGIVTEQEFVDELKRR